MPASFTSLRALYVLWASISYWATAQNVSDCPGYSASNVKTFDGGMTADLTLAGEACNVYGKDLHDLTFKVEYQTGAFIFSSRAPEVAGMQCSRKSGSGASRRSIGLDRATHSLSPEKREASASI